MDASEPPPRVTPAAPLRLLPRPARRPTAAAAAAGPGHRPVRARGAAVVVVLLLLLLLAAPAGAAPGGSSGAAAAALVAPCVTVGSSRAGRAWLPRARVVVPGVQVLVARAVTPGVRARAGSGLVEVQVTSRRSLVAGAPVVLELVLLDGSGRTAPYPATCTLAPALAEPGRGATPVSHGVRRLVRAD